MRKLILVSLLLFLTACAQTTVVLVPDDDDKVGQVVVSAGNSEQTLNTANAFTTVGKSVEKPGTMSAEEVARTFSRPLAALPKPAVSFLSYFAFGSADPDAASRSQIDLAVKAIKARPIPNVTVIGHTDRMGDPIYNQRLSMQRAAAVNRLLTDRGIDPAIISISGYGENDPIVPTKPGVAEPRNRRVEIFVR